jgi:hypothetical protein
MEFFDKIAITVRAILAKQKKKEIMIANKTAEHHNLTHTRNFQQGISRMPIITVIVITIIIIILAASTRILLTNQNQRINFNKNTPPPSPIEGLSGIIKAKNPKGIAIENSSTSESDTITFYEYYNSSNGYLTSKLLCTIDSFPAYCDGSPVILYNLPAGKHKFVITNEYGNAGMRSVSFSWNIIS